MQSSLLNLSTLSLFTFKIKARIFDAMTLRGSIILENIKADTEHVQNLTAVWYAGQKRDLRDYCYSILFITVDYI